MASDGSATTERPHPDRFAFWVVSFGVFVAADDLLVVATMLRPMIDDLGLVLPDDLDASAWIVNAYLIAYIAAIPIAGRLSDQLGRRAVFVAALLLFGLGSIVVPAADTLEVLLIGRALSALGGGALVPVALAVVGDRFAGGARTRAFGTLGAVETLGWVWGPLYGAILVRVLSWQWQFHINVGLAVVTMALGWLTLDPTRRGRSGVDWAGALLLTVSLIAVGIALLDGARIQSVSGLDELTRRPAASWIGPWLYGVAAAAFAAFVLVERRVAGRSGVEPVVAADLFLRRRAAVAMGVNALVGVALVITLVNVPLLVNIVDSDEGIGVGSSALRAGSLLTALTAALAVASYAGGRLAVRVGDRVPVLAGCALAALALATAGWSWTPETSKAVMAVELGFVGAGIGLVLAPTSAQIVEAAGVAARGSAAALVMLFRLIGFSIGLAALTAWGLHRYGVLRDRLDLPRLGDAGYEEALRDAAVEISTTALTETFLGASLALAAAVGLAALGAAVSTDPPRSRGGD